VKRLSYISSGTFQQRLWTSRQGRRCLPVGAYRMASEQGWADFAATATTLGSRNRERAANSSAKEPMARLPCLGLRIRFYLPHIDTGLPALGHKRVKRTAHCYCHTSRSRGTALPLWGSASSSARRLGRTRCGVLGKCSRRSALRAFSLRLLKTSDPGHA
jgi:hypothetical protein